jgi:NAD dependent epimerase/dehydratase
MKHKIFITGAAGFVGSHLTEKLIKKKYKVVAFDRYNSNNDFGWLNKIRSKNRKNFILGDIRDFDSVYNAMRGCKVVFHLAALIGIPYSYISPVAYLKTNVEGTYNVLEAARRLKIKNVIITSTSEVYGSAKYLPINENHPINSQSPYAASKAAADQLAMSFYKSFNLPVKIIRPFNIYGPRQSQRAIIPTIISQTLNKSKIITLGNVKPTRDFNYVLDVVDAFIKIMNSKKAIGQVLNVGSNKKISISYLCNEILKITNIKKNIKISAERKRPKLSEVENLQSDNKKIKKILSWSPKTNLKQGLKYTITWFKNNKSVNSEDYTV